MDADPDLRLYPFDRHALTVEIEPKTADSESLVFVADESQTGLDTEAQLPGWEYRTTGSLIENHSYGQDEIPYSRAVFIYGIQRDTASTVLKFFLPILLIVIVSLSSLLMKVSSRLGLNASMFLAAVLIHWRVADAIPLVAYATFLDIFMIITYATLVMVLVSGILLMKYTEAKDTATADRVYRWSIRFIPAVSIVLYIILFRRVFEVGAGSGEKGYRRTTGRAMQHAGIRGYDRGSLKPRKREDLTPSSAGRTPAVPARPGPRGARLSAGIGGRT